jgi:hypothetical protein
MMNKYVRISIKVKFDATDAKTSQPFRYVVGVATTVNVVMLKMFLKMF